MTQTLIETAFRVAEAGAPDALEPSRLLAALGAEAGALGAAMDALERVKAAAEAELVSLAARLEPVEAAMLALEAVA